MFVQKKLVVRHGQRRKKHCSSSKCFDTQKTPIAAARYSLHSWLKRASVGKQLAKITKQEYLLQKEEEGKDCTDTKNSTCSTSGCTTICTRVYSWLRCWPRRKM